MSKKLRTPYRICKMSFSFSYGKQCKKSGLKAEIEKTEKLFGNRCKYHVNDQFNADVAAFDFRHSEFT